MADPAIYHIRVVRLAKVLPANVHILLPGEPLPARPQPDTIYIPTQLPDMAEEDACLGRFLRTWGKLETALQTLFQTLLGAEPHKAHALFAALSGKSLRDAIEGLSASALNSRLHAMLVNLLERFSRLGTRRNFIVHGYWIGEIIAWNNRQGELLIKLEVMREYPVSGNKADGLANPRNQKIRSKHLFRKKKIDEVGNAALSLADDVNAFVKTLQD